MIRLLRDLPESSQRELLVMFRPEAALTNRDGLWTVLVDVIKEDVLQVRPTDDLPLALRRRLVEVAVERFKIVDSADELTDIEIALALADFLLTARGSVKKISELWADVETFFRTMPASAKAEALDESALNKEQITEASKETGGSLYDELSAQIESEAGRHQSAPGGDDVPPGVRMMQRLTTSGGGVAALAALSPAALGLFAGSAFMAGLVMNEQGIGRDSTDDESKDRARRARSSKLVQNVVRLSVFAVASIGDEERTRNAVTRYLTALGYEFTELNGGQISVTAGSATVLISVARESGRSIVVIRSRLDRGISPSSIDFADLLQLNGEQRLGKFSWDPDDEAVDVAYELLGDALDIDELGFALSRVADIADGSGRILKPVSGLKWSSGADSLDRFPRSGASWSSPELLLPSRTNPEVT